MGRVGLLRPYIRPAYTGAKLCGPAVTVLLQPGDNWMFHVAAEQVQEGDVIVAGCTTSTRLARAFLHDPLGKAKPVQHGKPRGLDHQARTDRLRLGKTLENDDAIACPREQ